MEIFTVSTVVDWELDTQVFTNESDAERWALEMLFRLEDEESIEAEGLEACVMGAFSFDVVVDLLYVSGLHPAVFESFNILVQTHTLRNI